MLGKPHSYGINSRSIAQMATTAKMVGRRLAAPENAGLIKPEGFPVRDGFFVLRPFSAK